MIRLTRILIITALLGCACMGCSSIGKEFNKAEAPDIENYTQFNGTSFAGPSVGFGGATSPDAMNWLKDAGYRTVINLRVAGDSGNDLEASRKAAQEAGLSYVHAPLNPSAPDPEVIAAFLAEAATRENREKAGRCQRLRTRLSS